MRFVARPAVLLVLLAMALNSLVTNPRWEWDVVAKYLTEESIVHGVWMTVQLTLITAVILLLIGIAAIFSMIFQVGPFD